MERGATVLAAILGLGALGTATAAVLASDGAAGRRAETERALEALRPALETARTSTLAALVDETRTAAAVPQLRAAFGNKVDTYTLDDLFQSEPWWRPHRSRGLVLVGPNGVIMSRNVNATDAGELAARATGASGGAALARVGSGAFILASAPIEVADRVPRVLVLALPIDDSLLQSWSDAVHAGLMLSLGRGGAGAAWGLPAGAGGGLVGHEGERIVSDAAGAWSAAAIALGPEVWMWIARAAPDVGRTAGISRPLLVVLAALLGFAALGLVVMRRGPRPTVVAGIAEPASIAVVTPPPLVVSVEGSLPPPRRSAILPTVIASADGQVFGRYTVLDRLGAGGMCDIYIAALTGPEGFQRTFVLKRLKPELALNRAAVDQFIDEAKLGSTLVHSNIVPVFDFGRVGDGYFIAQEFIVGRNVEQLCERHEDRVGAPLDLATVFYIGYETLQALGFAHDKTNDGGEALQIVHRDVSPGNILVSRLGEVKLIDFGIVKAVDRVSKTDIGNVKGNATFMSPEQARGLNVDRRADLFSLGLVMYRALAGEALYSGGTTAEIFYTAATGPTAEVFARLDRLPPTAARVLKRALMPDPADRYASAEEFAADLLPHVSRTAKPALATLVSALFGGELRSGSSVGSATGSLQRDAG